MTSAAKPDEAPGVVIAIPTCRRAQSLARLLDSLLPSAKANAATIVVGDNGCEKTTEQTVAAFRRAWPATIYLAVPERGLSANRNAILSACLNTVPAPRWIATVDDDIEVPRDWLSALLAAAERYGASAVGAPCNARHGAEPNAWVRNSMMLNRSRGGSGPCPRFGGIGNALIRADLLTGLAPPYFDPEFDFSGGEDYEFFRRLEQAGARFAWCEEAASVEHVAPDSFARKAIISRYFTTGAYVGRIDRRYEGYAATFGKYIVALCKSAARLALSVVVLNRDQFVRGLCNLVYAAGGLAGLAGLRHERYR